MNHSNSSSAPAWRFRPDIEGLRAVAIIGVILFHAGIRRVSGGFLGVDVFFVISGFLITGILVAEAERTGTIALGAFWARRARRLLPAATLVSLVTLLASARLDAPFGQETHAKSAIAFATYWSNLLFVRRGADYFDQTLATDPFLHTWSLAVEEQYYLVFAPLALLLTVGIWRGGRDLFRRRFLVCALAVTVVSFAGCLVLTAWKPLISFYGLPSRAWEFAIGGMLATLPARPTSGRASPRSQAIAIAGLGALVASWFLATNRTPHPGWITLLPVLGTAALIATRAPTLVARVLEMPLVRRLGRLSYSWYLWHWPIGVYWARLVPDERIPMVIGMPLVSLALAQLTYVTVEAPARGAPWLQGAKRGQLAALALAVATIVAGVASVRDSRVRLRDPKFAFIVEARDTQTRLHRERCHLGYSEIEPRLDRCAYGKRDADTTIVLMGDSHAAQWFAALEPIANARGWKIAPMTKSACPAPTLTVWLTALGREYRECDRWRQAVVDRLAVLKPTLIVLASSNWYEVAAADERGRNDSGAGIARPTSAQWRRGLQATVDRLPQSSAILLMADTPTAHFDVPTCLFENVDDVGRCAFRRDSAFVAELREAERGVGVDRDRFEYLDLTQSFCDAGTCAAARGGIALFADDGHVSVRYAATLSSSLNAAMDSALARRGARP